MPDSFDFVDDLTQRIIAEALPLTPEAQRKIDAAIRMDYGGDRPYIARHGESARAARESRDLAIIRGAHRGDSVALLARRHGISCRRVQQILDQNR